MAQYEASFKHPKCGKLWWVVASGKTEKIATEKMRSYVTGGYLLYGGVFLKK